MAADLAAGWEAYVAERDRAEHKFFKDKRRARRALEREFGPTRLRMDRGGREHLDRIVALKRDQYRRTGQHDVFACGWTRELLELLLGEDGDFGGRISLLEAGDEIVALEYSLVAAERRHFWFPTFEPRAARHSPGVLLTLDSLEAGARAGLSWFDFGLSGEPYKKYFANCGAEVIEGEALAPGWRTTASAVAGAVERFADRFSGGAVGGLRRRAERHLELIAACETSVAGRLNGALALTGSILARRRSTAQA
jgi:CelD/BcsL family acetyltransferase involved in cellulose biosynthesis